MATNNGTKKNNNNNKRHLVVRLKRQLRLSYLKILRIDDPPERIARGAAIGVFMGVFPTFGIGTFLAIGLAFIFRANKAAAVLGSFIMNPLTSPFFWTLSAAAGSLLVRDDYRAILNEIKGESPLNGIGRAYLTYLAGNVVVGAAVSLLTYYIVRSAVVRQRAHKAAKRQAATPGR
ncbi:MAG: DUF2062 domain-containing protein [Deltaproteobacteria bacterium]|nr:DUF2062 domain-containing protein [Deltaproteobacteria bacterium]